MNNIYKREINYDLLNKWNESRMGTHGYKKENDWNY